MHCVTRDHQPVCCAVPDALFALAVYPLDHGDAYAGFSVLWPPPAERKLCMYDGGSEIDLLKAVPENSITESEMVKFSKKFFNGEGSA